MTSAEGAQSDGYESLQIYVHGGPLSDAGEIELYAEEPWGSMYSDCTSDSGEVTIRHQVDGESLPHETQTAATYPQGRSGKTYTAVAIAPRAESVSFLCVYVGTADSYAQDRYRRIFTAPRTSVVFDDTEVERCQTLAGVTRDIAIEPGFGYAPAGSDVPFDTYDERGFHWEVDRGNGGTFAYLGDPYACHVQFPPQSASFAGEDSEFRRDLMLVAAGVTGSLCIGLLGGASRSVFRVITPSP